MAVDTPVAPPAVDVARRDADDRREVRRLPEAVGVGLGQAAAAVQQRGPEARRAHLDDAARRARAEDMAAVALDDLEPAGTQPREQAEDDAAGGALGHRLAGWGWTGTRRSHSPAAWP